MDGVVLHDYLTSPIKTLSEEDIWRIGQRDLTSGKRAYRMYRYVDIARDMVLSYFLRFYNVGSITFIEASAYTLTSVDRQRFSLSPYLKDNQAIRLLKTVLLTLLLSVFSLYVLVAIYNVGKFVVNLYRWRSHDGRQRRVARSREE
jgi:hypothetical protein